MSFNGLEIFYHVVKNDLVTKEDCVVAALHIALINKGNKCVGIGDEWQESKTNTASELLPEGWNSSKEVYTLRYVSSSSGKKYLVKIVKAGSSLLVNVLNVNEEIAAGMSVNIDHHVGDNFSDFGNTYKNLDVLGKAFSLEIVKKVSPKPNPTQSSKASGTESTSEGSSLYEFQDPYAYDSRRNPYSREPEAFPSVGRDDLDPLGRGRGGGMIYDPAGMLGRRPIDPDFGYGGRGGLPRGARPPGARFDPVGPPMPGRGPAYPPDPDHMTPPGYDDAFT